MFKPNALLAAAFILAVFESFAQTQVDWSGAMRVNYAWKDYDERNKDNGGDLDFELIRIGIDARQDDLGISAQYRWYRDFHTVHHAYFYYNQDEETQWQLGLNQVPFGLLPYTSNSFWFGGAYYIGLEDDYDVGVKYRFAKDEWTYHLAWYSGSEYPGDNYDRYSFDVAITDDSPYEEANNLVGRIAQKQKTASGSFEWGVSAQLGQILNTDTDEHETRYAFAVHADWVINKWTIKGEFAQYKFDIDNPIIDFSAFQFEYPMASEARNYSLHFARHFAPKWRFADTVTCYQETSLIESRTQDTESIQAVVGCNYAKGALYVYTDWIAGKNMWFSGGPGVAFENPNDDRWRSRFNFNFGWYF